MSFFRPLSITLLLVGLLSPGFAYASKCDARTPCPSGTGCCSQWGNCGWGQDFCGTGCVNSCNAVPPENQCSASKPCATGCCSQYGNCGWGPDFCEKGCINSCDAVSECDANRPCKTGCCGTNGVCGTGPDYCSPNKCINSCNAKAECDPGGWGPDFVQSAKCPLNVCCSKFGFCGTTNEFCGDEKLERPSCAVEGQKITRVVGYYEAWSKSRACHTMSPLIIPQGVYSHINFAFVSINPDTFQVVPASLSDESLYHQLKSLKTRDTGLELWLAIGGWSFNNADSPTVTTFSDLARADITYQNVFLSSLILFMTTWGFTGIDIDWEYPASDDRSGRPEDFENFPRFLANLRAALDSYGYGISITIPTSYWYLQHFDVASLEPYVDWFNVMSYDLHGAWDIGNEWTGATLSGHTNLTEIETALDLIWRNDISPSKVTLGLAFYGRTATLADPSCSAPGCVYASAGDAGPCSDETGILLNSEIADIVSTNQLSPTLWKDAAVKTITWGNNQWVAFDDKDTFKLKSDFAKSQCLGGVMVWAISHDDSVGTNAYGLAKALGNDINVDESTGFTWAHSGLTQHEKSTTNPQEKYCRWSNCGEDCPTGFSQITRDDKKSQIILDTSACSSSDAPGSQVWCCPKSSPLPVCRWRGHHNSGKCAGGCKGGEVEVGSIMAECHSGSQTACCSLTESTSPWAECRWSHCMDKEDATTCPSDFPAFITTSTRGSGGLPDCVVSQTRSYCCRGPQAPEAFTNCDWHAALKDQITLNNGAEDVVISTCRFQCPANTLQIAVQSSWHVEVHKNVPENCLFGNEAFCCRGPQDDDSLANGPRSVPTPYKDQTAKEFDMYLDKFFQDPQCPKGFMSKYDVNEQLGSRDVDQSSTLAWLLPVMSAWISANHPRQDLAELWNSYVESYGDTHGVAAANDSILRHTILPSGFDGQPLYDPEAYIASILCNIDSSYDALTGLDIANEALCVSDDEPTIQLRSIAKGALAVSNNISKRVLSNWETDGRAFGRPTMAQAMRGVISGELSPLYLRWVRLEDRNEVVLEIAYWIGTEPNETPLPAIYDRYRDESHTEARDRYIIFHFHILQGENVFRAAGNGDFNLGVVSMSVYHGQTMDPNPARGTSPRVQYRHGTSFPDVNVGPLANYNNRVVPITCPYSGSVRRRFYLGWDRSGNIDRFIEDMGIQHGGMTMSTGYARLLNSFGVHLHNQGYFSRDNLEWMFIMPREIPSRGMFAARFVSGSTALWEAFAENWGPWYPAYGTPPSE